MAKLISAKLDVKKISKEKHLQVQRVLIAV
jgi:hypothetical protein